jgi:hypothetical protein
MSHLFNNTAAHLRSDVPLCLASAAAALLLLLPASLLFSAAGSVRSLGNVSLPQLVGLLSALW